MSPSLIHLVARTRTVPSGLTLTHPEVAPWLWRRLREAFPDALAAVLMPDHLHLATLSRDPAATKRALARVVSGLRRSKHPGAAIRWDRTPRPDWVLGGQKSARVVRYIALNPCRAGLVRDPLGWPWSTHRDVVGAVADPWVSAPRLAGALERSPRRFAEHWHAYVSGDPSASIAGTPFPVAARPSRVAGAPLGDLVAAAAAASRERPDDVARKSATRTLFLRLAFVMGWRDLGLLAETCSMSPKGVYRSLRRARGRAAEADAHIDAHMDTDTDTDAYADAYADAHADTATERWARGSDGQGRSMNGSTALGAAALCLGDVRLRAWAEGAPVRTSSHARPGALPRASSPAPVPLSGTARPDDLRTRASSPAPVPTTGTARRDDAFIPGASSPFGNCPAG
ncbi:MAG: hypothetical protein IT373_30675 [Polyangiaceae bacterium]|nr:hypothetical protein [Polyangiaceae bacterium]